MSNDFKIMGVGSPILDLLLTVDDNFVADLDGDKGGMVMVSHKEQNCILKKYTKIPEQAPGGSAGNTIFGLAKLGAMTSFLGKIGNDSEGEFYTGELKRLGGDTSSFLINNNMSTGRCLSLITPDTERTMRTDLGAAASLEIADIKPEMFNGVKLVHIEGYMMFIDELFSKIIQEAKNANCLISLDLASFEFVKMKKALLPNILKNYVDIVFANEDEAETFCDTADNTEQLNILADYCDIAVVKIGEKEPLSEKIQRLLQSEQIR